MAVENWEMPAIGAGAAFLGSIPQMMEARRLKRERDRLLQEGPGGFTPIEQEQMAAARARAASALAPGYAQEMEGIAQQQADTLAAAKRGSTTGSNMLNVLSRMNAQGQAARRNLAMRGAQAQRQAQSELGSMAMGADARRMQRQQLYERQMAALDAARRQYATEPFMAPLKGAMAFMPAEGIKFTKNSAQPTLGEQFRFNPEKDMSPNPAEGMELGGGASALRLSPTPQMAGFNDQLNMAEYIGYDPYKYPFGNPYTNPYKSLPPNWQKNKK